MIWSKLKVVLVNCMPQFLGHEQKVCHHKQSVPFFLLVILSKSIIEKR